MYRLNKLFKEYLKNSDYEYNENISWEKNEANLKRMAHIKHTCKYLYESIERTFGEDYAEFIVTRVLNNDFKITSMEKFTHKEYVDTSSRIYYGKYFERPLVSARGSSFSFTLINFSTSLFVDLFQRLRHTGEIELYDLLICLSVLVKKWRITEYPKFILQYPNKDTEAYLKQYLKHIIFSLYAPSTELQPFTIAILDKELFERALKMHDYSVVINNEATERISPTYKDYIDCIDFIYDILGEVVSGNNFVQPKIRVYAYASNKLKPEILECISGQSGMSLGAVYDLFKHVNFDARVNLFDNPEFKKAMARLSDILTPRKFLYKKIKAKIKELINTDYIWYLNVINKKLAYRLEQKQISRYTTSLEVVYIKSDYKYKQHPLRKTYAEVTIDYNYVAKDCKSQEEYEERLYKAVIDASTILQMRMLIFPKIPRRDFYRLNIKLQGVEDEVKSVSQTVMSKAVEYLENIYNMPFDYQLTHRIYFRDKTRLNYELL